MEGQLDAWWGKCKGACRGSLSFISTLSGCCLRPSRIHGNSGGVYQLEKLGIVGIVFIKLICLSIVMHQIGHPAVYCNDSITMADAPPPPLQIPAQPILPFFSFSTPRSVVVILAPEAPSAWPRATAPPWRLTLSSLIPKIFIFASATTLNASLISKASTADISTLACFRALGIARAGAVVNLEGFCSASPHPRILPMGLRLCSLTAASDARTRAAAPSESGEALAGVTVPSFLKAERTVRVLASLN
jgi:hypothetical protein